MEEQINLFLKNYTPKGELEGFPKEIIAKMLELQEEQWGKIDVSVFEKDKTAGEPTKGFTWYDTREGFDFWSEVIRYENFALFFARYPKQYNSQEFRVGDKVFYYITNQIGIIKEVKKHKFDNSIDIVVDFGDNDICEYVENSKTKRPFLLHYRDDYDYDVIDFNNLPKRQGAKRWRAGEGEAYYSFTADFKVEDYIEDNDYFDNEAYDSGNYFQTKEEAEIIAQKLNTYFKQLIEEEPIRAIDLPLSEMQKGMLEEQKPKKTLTCYLGNDMSN